MMKQERIRFHIKDIVQGNLAWCDPESNVCQEQRKLHPEKCIEGYTFQSAQESLDDIICDLTKLQDELRIESSFQSAQL